MTIYEEFIQRVEEGEPFYINFKNRAMKIGKEFVITDGLYDNDKTLYTNGELEMSDVLSYIEMLYKNKHKHYNEIINKYKLEINDVE